MRNFFLFFSLFCSFALAEFRHIYKCPGSDGGIEYRNFGDTKGCERLEDVELTVVPSQQVEDIDALKRLQGKNEEAKKDEMVRLLVAELDEEEKRLAKLEEEYHGGHPPRHEKNYALYQERVERMKEQIDQSRSNIDALRREISSANSGRLFYERGDVHNR